MYQIALFIYVLGVLCLMGGHTLIHASLEVMRRARQVERVGDWLALAAGLDRFMPFFTLAVLVPGIFMAWTAWGWTTPWIDVSLLLFLASSLRSADETSPALIPTYCSNHEQTPIAHQGGSGTVRFVMFA